MVIVPFSKIDDSPFLLERLSKLQVPIQSLVSSSEAVFIRTRRVTAIAMGNFILGLSLYFPTRVMVTDTFTKPAAVKKPVHFFRFNLRRLPTVFKSPSKVEIVTSI